jgi:CBS domain-containing protein
MVMSNERISVSHKRRPIEVAERTRVADIMTRDVATVRADLSVDSLVELLLARDLSRVPVVDDNGRPIGMVAKTDVIVDRHVRGDTVEEGPATIPVSRNVCYSPAGFHLHTEGVTVDDVMSRSVASLPETASVSQAAVLMATSHLHGIPITSASGRVTGLVSATDIVAWVAGL